MLKRFALLLCLSVSLLHAHPLDLGFLQLNGDGSKLRVRFDFNPKVAATLLTIAEPLQTAVVQSRVEELMKLTLASGPLTLGSAACHWLPADVDLNPQLVQLKATADCGSGKGILKWEFAFLENQKLPPSFQVMVRSEINGAEHVTLAERGKTTVQFSLESSPHFWQFVVMGIEHIGAAPSEWYTAGKGFHFPDGIDHILFLLALILGGGTLLQLIGTATGFTVGHSITLALASAHLVQLPSRFVESAIALSIAYVAGETMVRRQVPHRWKIALLFGLVHGFGFASALSELHLTSSSLLSALVGFNFGVEIGQAFLVTLFAPLVFFLRSRKALCNYAIPACSFLIFLAGSYWFVQRAFGLGA